MNNEMTLNAREMKTPLVMNQTVSTLLRPLHAITSYYSNALERPVSTRQTLHLLNAQLAFVATVFVDSPILMRLLCLAWFVASVMKCRKAMTE